MSALKKIAHYLRRIPTPLLIIEVVLALFLSGIWFYLWRYPLWSIDDLYFVTRDGYAWGATTFSDLWSDLIYDVGERNGRIADLLLQMLFASTTALWLVFPLICIAFGVSVYLSVKLFTSSHWNASSLPQFLALCVGGFSLFIISAFAPHTPGTTIMFMAAAVGYLGGFILLFAVFLLAQRVYTTTNVGVWLAFIPVTLIAAWHHEMIAGMIAIYLISLSLIYSDQEARKHLIILLGLIVTVSRFAAPGMWARRGDPSDHFPSDSFIVTKASEWMYNLQEYLFSRYELWLPVALLVVAFNLFALLTQKELRKALLPIVVVNIVSLIILFASLLRLTLARGKAGEADYILVFQSKTSLIGFFACVIHLLCMVALLYVLRRSDSVWPLLPLAGAYAGLALTLLSGSAWDRPLFLSHTLLLVFMTSTIIVLTQAKLPGSLSSPNLLRGCTYALSAAIVAYLFVGSYSATVEFLTLADANTTVQGRIAHRINQIRSGEATVLYLPDDYPSKKYFDWYQPRESVQERYLQYYDLAPSTPVVIVPADQIP